MRRRSDPHNNFGRIWSAHTRNFAIYLILEEEQGYRYDGDDPDGSIQAALDEGDMVAFGSIVEVEYEGAVIGSSMFLGGSVYHDGKTLEFLHSGYLTDMLNEACDEARRFINNKPRLREVA
ncbi:hypothetical protein LZK73_21940 [Neorhizobium galegae]|nr:hypothetical protein LZK73_21940 [Neorhizobium galegae]